MASILILTIGLNPGTDDPENPYQWRVIEGFNPEDGDVDGGWIDVASEDYDEWVRQADEFIGDAGYRRTGDWVTDEGAGLSGAIVERV